MIAFRLKSVATVVGSLMVALFSSDGWAISCNPKAESHQRRAWGFKSDLRNVSKEDLDFLLCMTPEKEDKEDLIQRWHRLQAEKRAFEEQQQKKRAEETERQQREEQRAKQLAQEEAAREAQAEHLVVPIQGTEGNYYIGRVTSDDVVLVEPVQGRYSRISIVVSGPPTGNYRPGLSHPLGQKLRDGEMGGVGRSWDFSGPLRVKVRDLDNSLSGGIAGNALLSFRSSENMQVRVTILCVQGTTNPPCKNR